MLIDVFLLQRHGSAEDPVPVAEEGSVVAARLLVVQVVGRGATQQTEGHQVVQGPGQVVAYVVLHGHPDAQNCYAPCAQWVTPQKNRVQVAPEAHSHQFWNAELLRGPGEWSHVFMVNCMHPAVQLQVLVVHKVPDEVLGVKEEQYSQSLGEQLI